MADTVTLDEVTDDTTSRRGWLKWLGAAGGLGGVGWLLWGDADVRPLAWSVALDPHLTDVKLTRERFTAQIHPDADGDEWLLRHEYQEPSEAIATGALPELGGAVEVSLADIDRDAYPTDRFRFVLVSVARGEDGDGYEILRESGVEFSLPA